MNFNSQLTQFKKQLYDFPDKMQMFINFTKVYPIELDDIIELYFREKVYISEDNFMCDYLYRTKYDVK